MYTFIMRFNDGKEYKMGQFDNISEFMSYKRMDMIDMIYATISRKDPFASAQFVWDGEIVKSAALLKFPGWPKRKKIKLTDGLAGDLSMFNI